MKEVAVRIEEHLFKEFLVQVDTDDATEAMEYAEDYVNELYNDGKISLTHDDFSGISLYQSACDSYETEWDDTYVPPRSVPKDMCKLIDKK